MKWNHVDEAAATEDKHRNTPRLCGFPFTEDRGGSVLALCCLRKHLKILLHSLYTQTVHRLFVRACACLCAFKAMVLKPGSSGLVGEKANTCDLETKCPSIFAFLCCCCCWIFFHMLYFSLPKTKRFKAHLNISTQEGFCCCNLNLNLDSSRQIFLSFFALAHAVWTQSSAFTTHRLFKQRI